MNLDAERERLLALAGAQGTWGDKVEMSNERELMRLAGISTAAIGHWKEGDSIHPDYDTVALRDVAKLYAEYDALYKQTEAQAAELERLRADAERWRFVLEHGMPHQDSFRRDPHFVRQVGSCVYYGATKTEVIDAAIAAERKGAG